MIMEEKLFKKILLIELIVGLATMIPLVVFSILFSFIELETWLHITVFAISFLPFLIVCPFLIWIEQFAGYYKCEKCGNVERPTIKEVAMAPHIGRSRRMRCHKCGKKSY